MTQQDKELLLKDLCARLPYGVICQNPNGMKFTLRELNPKQITLYGKGCIHDFDGKIYYIGHIKPYLRPRSSMTEEEQDEFFDLIICVDNGKAVIEEDKIDAYNEFMYLHHFDNKNLIDKGLALEAPDGMYN